MEQERWHEAAEALQEAMAEVERLRIEALSLDRRMQILRENIHIYERLLVRLMKLGRYRQALEVAERGKSQTLIDLLTLRDLRPKNAPPEVVHEYERMLFRARALEDQLQRGDGPDAGAETLPPEERAARRLQQKEEMRQELVQTLSRLRQLVGVIRQHDADFLPTAKSLTVEEITALAKYEGLIGESKSKLEALRDAQLWLRDATAGELSAVLSQKAAELGRDRMAWTDFAPLTREMRFGRDPTERPFAHPHFWAGMQCVGV